MLKTILIALGLMSATAAMTAVFVSNGDETSPAEENGSEGRRRGRAAKRGDRPIGGDERESGDLEARVARLERDIRTLRAAAGMRNFAAAVDDDGSFDGESGAEPDPSPEFRERVQAVLEDDRAEREERRSERRRERFEQRTEQMIETLAERAGLTNTQREQLSTHLATQRDQIMALVEEGRAGDRPWPELREAMAKARDHSDAALGEFLDEKQLAAYQELREEEGPGFGGRGRRGPPLGP